MPPLQINYNEKESYVVQREKLTMLSWKIDILEGGIGYTPMTKKLDIDGWLFFLFFYSTWL